MSIAIGSDHAGFHYKARLRTALAERGERVTDFGTDSDEPVDYPLVIRPLAEAVAAGRRRGRGWCREAPGSASPEHRGRVAASPARPPAGRFPPPRG